MYRTITERNMNTSINIKVIDNQSKALNKSQEVT